jgi:hypothetical protein
VSPASLFLSRFTPPACSSIFDSHWLAKMLQTDKTASLELNYMMLRVKDPKKNSEF